METDFIQNLAARIPVLDDGAMRIARDRQEILTKPSGSLGRLEEISIRIAGITGRPQPTIQNKVVLLMAGDHGVVSEKVSAYPQEVTFQMVMNFLKGGAAINVLARHVQAKVVVVDMGIVQPVLEQPGLIVRKIASGTGNISIGPAMSRDQAILAIRAGAEIVDDLIRSGIDILATGDMGIGNTTASAAVATSICGCPVEEMTGRGTGIDEQGLFRKIAVIKRALDTNRPDPSDALDVLSKVGGFEIAGLVGAMLASATKRIPVVIDGFVSTSAAIIAVKLAPVLKEYLTCSHLSQEPGHQIMMEWLGIAPLFDLKLRLGEGTGAVLGISLVEASCKVLSEMSTFEEAAVAIKEAV